MYVGFDIGGTTARATLFDADLAPVADARRRVRDRTSPEEVADLVASLIGELTDAPSAIESVGLALAAQLNREGTLVCNAPNLGWRDVPFVEHVDAALEPALDGAEAILVNDLDALLLGESLSGAVRESRDVLAVSVGTGVGGALLIDGQPVAGTGGTAGEIGHSKVEPGGRLCGCGQRGCVEAYAGGIHLEDRIARVAREHERPNLLDGDTGDLGAADAVADEFEPVAEIWDEATDTLSIVVANACTLVNPEVLLLAGGVIDHCDTFRRQLTTRIPPLVLDVAREVLDIRYPDLGERAAPLGAARRAADLNPGS